MIRADAFNIPLKDQSVDMIITSPPFFYNLSAMVKGRNPKYESKIFGLERSEISYRAKLHKAIAEMKRVCKGAIWLHTSRPDLAWDEDVMMLEPWHYPESDVFTFWVGWKTPWTSFTGWKEEPTYKDGHWGVFPDKLVRRLIYGYAKINPSIIVLDPFAGTGVVGRMAAELGCTGMNMDIKGGVDAS